MNRPLALSLTLGLILHQVALASATDDAFEFFQEEAKVVTASRREQSISEVPMAVDVITAKQIKDSGATNLWDVLRFRPGMDVLDGRSVDGNRGVVSVRGFPQEFAPNLLVLLDGRAVYSAYNNGTFWEQLPVQMQDIERIEIIRGPNAALYGTGAALGVINIITRRPDGKTTAALDMRGGSLGLLKSQESVDSAIGKMAYRVSHGYHIQAGAPRSANSQSGNDFLNRNTADFRGDLRWSEHTNLELFTGGSWMHSGIETVSRDSHDDFDSHFQMAKLSHQSSPHSTIEISGSRNDTDFHLTPVTNEKVRTIQYDAEILHRLSAWGDRLNTTYGAAYRRASAESSLIFTSGDHRPYIEFNRGYLQETVKPIDLMTLQGAAALEHSNVSGLFPSYQGAAIVTPHPEHAFRASYSVAHTSHDLFPLFGNLMNSPVTQFVPNPDLTPYKITSYELGYRGRYAERHLDAEASLFYTKVDHFHFTVVQSQTVNPVLISLQFQDHDTALARGAETGLTYHFSSRDSVYLNYTYENITDRSGDSPGLRTDNTPAHKVNFGGAADLGKGFSGSMNVGYKDSYFITSEGRSLSVAAPAYWRLDARLAYTLPWYKDAELYVAGQNLAESEHVEFADGLAVSRTYEGGVTVKFGGNE